MARGSARRARGNTSLHRLQVTGGSTALALGQSVAFVYSLGVEISPHLPLSVFQFRNLLKLKRLQNREVGEMVQFHLPSSPPSPPPPRLRGGPFLNRKSGNGAYRTPRTDLGRRRVGPKGYNSYAGRRAAHREWKAGTGRRLGKFDALFQSGVALRLPPHSKRVA